jgi:hypothetical protein
MEEELIKRLLVELDKDSNTSVQLIQSLLPSVIAIIAIVFGFIQSRVLLKVQKKQDIKAENRKILLEKSEQLLFDLYSLDNKTQYLLNNIRILIGAMIKNDNTDRIVERSEESREKFLVQYMKCKVVIGVFYPMYLDEFEKYSDKHNSVMKQIYEVFQNKYNQEERVDLMRMVQEMDIDVHNKLDGIIKKIVADTQNQFIEY